MNEIVEAMARTLFVTTYADMAERHPDKFEIACCGVDWMDIAPETTVEARYEAWRLCGRIEELNRMNIYCLAAAASRADDPGHDPCDRSLKYDQDFGHYLVMQSLGHGVSWFDKHEEFPLKFPHIEVEPEDVGLVEPEGGEE